MDLHAQLLLRDAGLPDGARESARADPGEARQLTRMILNLLDISKADEGQARAAAASMSTRGRSSRASSPSLERERQSRAGDARGGRSTVDTLGPTKTCSAAR